MKIKVLIIILLLILISISSFMVGYNKAERDGEIKYCMVIYNELGIEENGKNIFRYGIEYKGYDGIICPNYNDLFSVDGGTK